MVPIADFPLSSSRIVGESTRLILEGGRFATGFFLDLSGDKMLFKSKELLPSKSKFICKNF